VTVTTHRICAIKYTQYRSDPRVRREAEALAARGDDVTVLALREAGRPALDYIEGVRVIGLPVERYRGGATARYLASYARFFARAAAHLARRPHAYDLIHVHTLPEAMVFAAVVPKIAGRPVLLDVGDLSSEVFLSRKGTAPAPVRWAEWLSLRFADRVVTVHDEYRDRVSRRGVSAAEIAVVLNAPDDRLFPLCPASTPAQPPTLLYHGLLAERYGLASALEGVAAARSTVPGVRLEVVGDGDFRATMVELIARLGLDETVSLSRGAVPIDDIPARIAAADIGLVPFQADPFTEAILPTKLLEYVRMGKPVIVARNPVIERYFSDDDVYFVEPGRADDIADAIRRIDQRPDEARARASRAQRFFGQHGWLVNRSRFLAVVDGLLPA
jgi:glycosyltransferase involved in cell wall biosynthesis